MNPPMISRWRAALPHLLVACWLLYLAITIWQHAITSAQTVWGDALSYLQKAASFWRAIGEGRFFNPLNLFPSVRPPGSILMSYPFGLSADHHGYHFRSIFLPIVSVVAAVYVAAGKTTIRVNGWRVAAIAFLFSSLPMFYWFDWNEDRWIGNGWGMVDSFQAGIAALAGAAVVRSLATRSQPWLLVASLLACLTFLVKQSGLMLMGVLGLTWLIVLAFEWRLAERTQPARLRAYGIKGAWQMLIVYGVVVTLSVFSQYFSRSNFAWAMKALGFYREIAPAPSLSLLHFTAGEALIFWLFAISVLFLHRLSHTGVNRADSAGALGLLTGSVVIWISGLWYWMVVQAGGTQIRYFYPFLLMGSIYAIPAALHAWSSSNRWVSWFLMLVCFVPALNIACLLVAGDSPSVLWQWITGVSVSVGQDRREVDQAKLFLSEVRKAKKDARVYFFPNGVLPETFIFVGVSEKIVRPELPSFSPVDPMDWSRGFAVRTGELLDSDYVLVRKNFRNREGAARFASKSFDTFDAEFDAFDGWLSTLNEESGVAVASDGPLLRVLRIVDRDALSRAVERFVADHAWRPEFVAANVKAPPTWWHVDAVAVAAPKSVAADIRFGELYKLHALSIDRVGNDIKIEAWWEELRHEDANDRRYLFLHLVDASGAILYIHQIALHPYKPPDSDRKLRYSSETFLGILPNASITSLAFGVYEAGQADGGYLMPDKGQTDWGGKRVLVRIPTM